MPSQIIPVHAELTTREAADILNISRPSLIQLLDEGKMEYRRVGTHRRVRFNALMKYKRHADEQRRAVLEELAAYDQELGIEGIKFYGILRPHVLYGSALRNLLMHRALTGLFRAKWSAGVPEEWIAALLRNRPDLSRDSLSEHEYSWTCTLQMPSLPAMKT